MLTDEQGPRSEKAKLTAASVWLRGIGKLRDGLLIFGAATYGLGYLVWAVHAWREQLGLLPALEPQYITAGVIPMLLIWLAFYGFKGAKPLPGKVATWRDRRLPKFGRGLGFACLFADYIMIWRMEKLEKWQSLGSSHSFLLVLMAIVETVLLVIGVNLAFYPGAQREPSDHGFLARMRSGFSKIYVRVVLYFFLAGYLAIFAITYVFVLYPRLPQEFGGVRPRCAYIDIAKDQVSEITRKEILPSGAAESKSAIAQSVRMKVYFSTTEFMLVRADPGVLQANQPKPKLFELRKDAIKVVNWCD